MLCSLSAVSSSVFYLCCLLLVLLPVDADAAAKRSRAQVNKFLQQQGLTWTPPGYEVDHIVPLCAGGRDAPENMQLLTKDEHRKKTREDIRMCKSEKR